MPTPGSMPKRRTISAISPPPTPRLNVEMTVRELRGLFEAIAFDPPEGGDRQLILRWRKGARAVVRPWRLAKALSYPLSLCQALQDEGICSAALAQLVAAPDGMAEHLILRPATLLNQVANVYYDQEGGALGRRYNVRDVSYQDLAALSPRRVTSLVGDFGDGEGRRRIHGALLYEGTVPVYAVPDSPTRFIVPCPPSEGARVLLVVTCNQRRVVIGFRVLRLNRGFAVQPWPEAPCCLMLRSDCIVRLP
jgi:hypothetical protein